MTVVDVAFDLAAAETGTGVKGSKLRVCLKKSNATRSRYWTRGDDDFLSANLGRLSESEIARRLRRTPQAVGLRWKRELHLPAPSKRTDVLTAENVAIGVCKDSKSIHLLIDRGIMPGRRMPAPSRIRLVDRIALMKWLLNPGNWVYIDPARIGELRPRGTRAISVNYDFAFWEEVARVVQARRRRWDDEWLTPGQVAKMLNLPSRARYINIAIRNGNLSATRWGNWWIRKSAIPTGMTLNFRGEWIEKVR